MSTFLPNCMRNLIIALVIITTFFGCKPYAYFTNGNDFLKANCKVYLTDSSTIEGLLTVQFETGQATKDYVNIITSGNVQKQIAVTDIVYFEYNNDFYYPKIIDLEAYEIPGRDKIYTLNVNNLLFLKEITKSDVKLHLFELFEPRTKTLDGIDHYDYYIALNKENRFLAWSIRGKKLFPDFGEKMSAIVSDCPQLSEKIKQKQSGYSLKQTSLDNKKEEVMKRIVLEYNNCK